MPKRKLKDISTSEPSLVNSLTLSQRRQQQRFLGYLENGQVQLQGALKLAKGFERQKLGRRHKDARNKAAQNDNGKEVGRIDAEIAALKALDLSIAAEFYIARTLCRIKTIASSPLLPEKIRKLGAKPSPYRTPADANITARLFKSLAVKNAMESIEEQVRTILNGKASDSLQHPSSDPARGGMGSNELNHERQRISGSDHGDSTPDESESELDNLDMDHLKGNSNLEPLANSTEFGDNDQSYSERLASGSEQDSESESGFVTNHESSITQTEAKPKATTRTTFLPSLASGYISGSESDLDGSSAAETSSKPRRKNRMGQQARRALAEKQYGASANHLKDEKGKKGKGRINRDSGWDLKRGATDVRGRGDRGGFFSGAVNSPKERKPATRAKDDTGPLHPSWVAKKKIKEQQIQGGGTYQGKKIVFE